MGFGIQGVGFEPPGVGIRSIGIWGFLGLQGPIYLVLVVNRNASLQLPRLDSLQSSL